MKLLINGGAVDTVVRIRWERPDLHKYIGWMNTPKTGNSIPTLLRQGCSRISLDNAAYADFCKDRYKRMLQKWESVEDIRVDWVTVPDVVGDAKSTMSLFQSWGQFIPGKYPKAFVGQDGAEDMILPWNEFECFFVGGTTEWKLSQCAQDLTHEAKSRGKLVHVGRVNSYIRLRYAHYLCADSVDGTGYNKYNKRDLLNALEYIKALHDQLSIF